MHFRIEENCKIWRRSSFSYWQNKRFTFNIAYTTVSTYIHIYNSYMHMLKTRKHPQNIIYNSSFTIRLSTYVYMFICLPAFPYECNVLIVCAFVVFHMQTLRHEQR